MKYLYILVGSPKGFYCEQTLVSMASLKHVVPDSVITLLVDKFTDRDYKTEIARIQNYVSEYIVVPNEDNISPIARSRYIKTSMRKYVDGDFLYVDADTVWNSPPEESDFTHDVMGVLDGHCLLNEHPAKKWIENDFRKVKYNPKVEKYINGGILFSKDSDASRKFFEHWHEKWMETSASGYFIDMPSLNYAIKQIGDSFALLPDSYNVQISLSWEHFFRAKVIHFFTGWQKKYFESPYLFQKESFWNDVREKGLCESVVSAIENPLSSFKKMRGVYGPSEFEFRQTALYGFMVDMYSKKANKKTFYLLEWLVNRMTKVWR